MDRIYYGLVEDSQAHLTSCEAHVGGRGLARCEAVPFEDMVEVLDGVAYPGDERSAIHCGSKSATALHGSPLQY